MRGRLILGLALAISAGWVDIDPGTLASEAVNECVRRQAYSNWMPPEARFVESRPMSMTIAFSARWGWFVEP